MRRYLFFFMVSTYIYLHVFVGMLCIVEYTARMYWCSGQSCAGFIGIQCAFSRPAEVGVTLNVVLNELLVSLLSLHQVYRQKRADIQEAPPGHPTLFLFSFILQWVESASQDMFESNQRALLFSLRSAFIE